MHVRFSHSFCDPEFYNVGTDFMKDHVHLSALNLLLHVMPIFLSQYTPHNFGDVHQISLH